MRPLAAAALVVVTGLVAACNRVAADYEDVCLAHERSGALSEPDPARRASKLAEWVDGRLRTDEARRTISMLSRPSLTPEDKSRVILEAAREAGYTGPCPMAEPPQGTPAPR